jgi:hypothetical protein
MAAPSLIETKQARSPQTRFAEFSWYGANGGDQSDGDDGDGDGWMQKPASTSRPSRRAATVAAFSWAGL